MKSILSITFLGFFITCFGQRSFNISTVPPGSYATTAAQIAAKQDSLNWYTPEHYGAVGDGVSNDAAAFNAMIAAMPTNATVNLSAKTYVLNSTLLVNKSIKIQGSGIGSIFKCGTNNIVMIQVSADYVTMRDFFMYNLDAAPSSGCAIRIDSSGTKTTPVAKFTMDNIVSNGFYNSIEAINTYGWTITNCQINFINYGVKVSSNYVDAGDSHISGCVFSPRGGFTGNTAIYQTNSGGLRIVNNKFNYNSVQKYAYAYYADIGGTSDLIITANSFENYTANAIRLISHPSYRFSNVSITGNQFSALNTTSAQDIKMDTIDNLSIQGNVFTKYYLTSTDTAISIRSANYSNINNTYYSYTQPVRYYGTNTNIVGDGAGYKLASMTKSERDALSSPPAGFMIYQTDNTPGLRVRNGSAWVRFTETTD